MSNIETMFKKIFTICFIQSQKQKYPQRSVYRPTF